MEPELMATTYHHGLYGTLVIWSSNWLWPEMNNHVGRDGLALSKEGLLSTGHTQKENLTFQSMPFVLTTLGNEKKP